MLFYTITTTSVPVQWWTAGGIQPPLNIIQMNCLDLLCCNCHLPPNPSPAYINSAGCCFLLCLFSSFTNFLIFLTLLYNPHQQLLLFSCYVWLSCGWFSFLLRDNVFNPHNLLPGLSGSSSVFHGFTEGSLDGLPTGHPLLQVLRWTLHRCNGGLFIIKQTTFQVQIGQIPAILSQWKSLILVVGWFFLSKQGMQRRSCSDLMSLPE